MPVIAFGEYRPDVSDYEASTERDVQNVVPRGDGYGPFPSLTALSQSLGAQCRGAFEAINYSGAVAVFAATSTDLYLYNNTTAAWSRVSQGGVSYAAIPSSDQWWFRQFGTLVICGQANVVPQYYDLSSSSAFANLQGSPPQARYADVVGRFLVLGGLINNPNRIQWSGLNEVNDANAWTPGLNSSDYQDFPDGGFVRGLAGGENGVIFQDTIIRRMVYLPGDPRVFQIEKIAEGIGLYAPLSVARAGSTVFFYSLKGFHRIDPGSVPVPIGRERVDRTFFADLDVNNLQLFQGVADPRSSRILWCYKSVNGSVNQFDKALCYDAVLDKFTPLQFSGEYLFQMAQPGVTLEGLDQIAPNGMAVLGAVTPATTQSAAATSTTGGTLSAATYYYKVTAIIGAGETVASNEQSVATTGTTSSNTVSWSAVAGATGYRVYRGTATGAENVYYAVGAVTSFVDTGAASTAGTPPSSGPIRIQVSSTVGLAAPVSVNLPVLGTVSAIYLSISGVGGTTEANGNWWAQIADGTHFDLLQSSFVHAYTSGGIVGGQLDLMTQSLDNFATQIQPELAAFDPAHVLNFFRGPALQAILETSEQGTDGKRIKLKKGFRPITDAGVVYGSASQRENQQQSVTAGTESLINPITGVCNMLLDTRYSRFKVRIPAGTSWNFINGVEPLDMAATGRR